MKPREGLAFSELFSLIEMWPWPASNASNVSKHIHGIPRPLWLTLTAPSPFMFCSLCRPCEYVKTGLPSKFRTLLSTQKIKK